MKLFKKILGLAIVMAIVMSLFAGFSVQAENGANVDDTYVYIASEQNWQQYHCIVSSDDPAYVNVETTAADPYFFMDIGPATSEYPILAVKYAFLSSAQPHTNRLYMATSNQGWTACNIAHEFKANDKWNLNTYNVRELCPNMADEPMKSFRLLGAADAGKTSYFAYFGFFKSVEDAQAYDAWYVDEYGLEDFETEEREELTPDAFDNISETSFGKQTFDFTGLEDTYDLTADVDIGSIFELLPGNGKLQVMEEAFNLDGFVAARLYERWLGGSVITFDMKNGSESTVSNFHGFALRFGNEGSNPFYEEDLAKNQDGEGAKSVGTTGIGVSYRDENKIGLYIKCLDDEGLLRTHEVIFTPVENVAEFNSFKVVDYDNGTIEFYANDKLFATVKFSNPKMTEKSMAYSELYYQDAAIYDAEGNELAKVSNALISTQSCFAFGSRASIISVDNITFAEYIDPNATPKPTEVPTPVPTQAPTAAPTKAPEATKAPATEEKDGGCGSSAALAQIMLVLGAAVVIKKRK